MLNLNHISNNELPILANVLLISNNGDKEKVLNDLHLIDDLLGIQKSGILFNSLFRKTRSGRIRNEVKNMRAVLIDRISYEIQQERL